MLDTPPPPDCHFPPNSPHDSRVGRTARYLNAGRALLLLLPSESEGMLPQLEGAKVPITVRTDSCAVLCCAVLCCAVLCCAVLCCAVLGWAGLGCAVLCCAVLCCAVL